MVQKLQNADRSKFVQLRTDASGEHFLHSSGVKQYLTGAWVVVESASASVSPTVADSGKYYRLSHANPTFNLPTTGLVVGETEFWVTFANAAGGVLDAGTGKTIDFLSNDSGLNADVAQSFNCLGRILVHLKYVATDAWASNAIVQI